MIRLDLEIPAAAFPIRVRCDLGGRVTVLVGPSGSGKTSVLESIAGLRAGASGRIEAGEAVFLDSAAGVRLPPERRRVGYVPQDGALFPHLTARRNIEFAARDPELFPRLVSVLELEPLLDRMPRTLSGGEKQRVAIARALMARPRLLLLDEPLAAVDAPHRERIVAFLRRLRATFSIPMIYVTHQTLEALALADEVVALHRGAVVAQGPAAEVMHRADVAGEEAAENVVELVRPLPSRPGRGVLRAETAEGMAFTIPAALADPSGSDEPEWPLLIHVGGDEVVVFTEEPRSLSARNVFSGPILRLERAGGTATLLVGTPTPLRVRITELAAADLGLAKGGRVWLALRTRSIRAIR